MWKRSNVKKDGWASVKKSLLTAVLITIIFLIISNIFSVGQNTVYIMNQKNLLSTELLYSNSQTGSDSSARAASVYSNAMALSSMQIFLSLLALAAMFFLINPLGVGYSRWFLSNRKHETSAHISELFSPFQQGCYMGVVSGTAWKSMWSGIWASVASYCFIPLYAVFIFVIYSVAKTAVMVSGSNLTVTEESLLHSFLLIAPTYIILFSATFLLGLAGYMAITLNRKYAYFFTQFILAENPTIGAKNALNRSKRMTYGIKLQLFYLELSFIGWWLLAIITCGILSLGVLPYTQATYAEAYINRKNELHMT